MNIIIDKPWGSEEILHTDDKYTVKSLFMKKGHKCSLQYHKVKQETIIIIDGILKINDTIFSRGEYITIYPNNIHRMEGMTDVIYLECSTSELDDVVRLEDRYGRV
jgi:mannose-6-phosphate isomerase